MEFFGRNMDYVYFIYGLSFILLAVLCRSLARDQADKFPWPWLGLFGLYHCFAKWLDVLAFSLGDNQVFLAIRLSLQLIAYVCLIEFGRSGFRPGGRPVAGAWLLPALTLLTVAAGIRDGLAGINAAARYLLVFPGSLLAMLALVTTATPGEDAWKRRGIVLAAASLLVFGLTQWVVPVSAITPALINEALFQDALGFPVQLWRVVAVLGCIAGLWVYRLRLVTGMRARSFSVLTPLLLINLLLLGWISAESRGRNRDAEKRDRLLEQVSALARAVNPNETKYLAFTQADETNVRHQRLKGQLKAIGRLLDCRDIFTLALRNGILVYGPCAFSASPNPIPGDPYQHSPAEDVTRLFKGEPYVTGPVYIRGIPVISARAPVRDPQTGQVLMTVGLDLDPGPWLHEIARARLIPIAGTMLLLLTLLIGIDMIRTRDLQPLNRQGLQRHLEAVLVLLCGAVITLFIALLIHETEIHRRHSVFDRLADSRTNQIRDEMTAIRADLQSLALFFSSSDFVSRAEFASFVSAIIQADAVEAFAWVPVVPAGRRAAFEAELSKQGPDPYQIWDLDRDGRPVPAAGAGPQFFPIGYLEPQAEHNRAIGYDLGRDPRTRDAIRVALESGLITATPVHPFVHQPGLSPVIFVFQPVSPPPGPGGPPAAAPGLAAGVIRFANLLRRASDRSGLGERFVNLGLLDLTDIERPALLAAQTAFPGHRYDTLSDTLQLPLANLQPIFAFGRTFAVVCHPTPAFWKAYPVRGGLTAGGAGLLLSLLLALFVAFLRKRQWDLEREVDQRTEALRMSQENLSITLNSIGDAVIATDATGIVRQLNPAAERLTGWAAAEAEGRPLQAVFNIVNSRTREKVTNPVDRVVATGHVVGLANHTALIARNGTVRQISDSAAPIRDASGATIGVVLVFSDVTQEYADRLRLEESEMQYRLLAEHASDVIGRISPDGLYLYLSPSSRHVMGYEPAELLGRNMLENVHPDDAAAVSARFKKALGRPEGTSVVLRFRHKNGSYHWLETAGRRVMEPGTGRASELIIVSRDITERRNAEEERLEMERRLLHAQKLESLGVLTGGIAHDFNNLLTAVLGNLELAQALLKDNGQARASIDQAANAARRAAGLTRQMLAYSGKGLFLVTDLNVNELVEENASMLKAAISKTVTLNLSLAPEVPLIKADGGQIQQVVMNLITNASEAIGDRPGIITLATGDDAFDDEALAASRLPDKPPAGRFVWIEVSDTGCGMTADTLNRIFEPFFTTKFTGRGLGMSVVLGIVRGHHGAILLDSRVDSGSSVRVLFPISENQPGSQASRQIPGKPGRPEADRLSLFDAGGGAPLRGTVLVVDDELIVQEICAAAVAFSGYRTLTASDGEEGVAVFREHADEIVAVILDLTMPRMDGATAFREMRRIRPDVRVILSSGHAEQEAFRRFDSDGAAGFLQKPYELKALQTELERVVRSGGA
jgi:PAS domain S-box-containing protein